MNKPNKIGWLVVIVVVVATLLIVFKNIYQDETHAVIATYKFVGVPIATSLVLHDGSFILDEVKITEGTPQALVTPKRKGVRSLGKILDGPAENVTDFGSGTRGLEVIFPKKFDTVTLVGLIDGEVVATNPVPVGSHWNPPEERITSGILELQGTPYLGVRIMAVGVVQKHHDQFFIFK